MALCLIQWEIPWGKIFHGFAKVEVKVAKILRRECYVGTPPQKMADS